MFDSVGCSVVKLYPVFPSSTTVSDCVGDARAISAPYLFVFLCELAGHSVRDFVQVGADSLFLCVASWVLISQCEYCPSSERAF